MYQNNPCLVKGVTFYLDRDKIFVSVGSDEFSIDLDSENLAKVVMDVMHSLNTNFANIPAIIEQFDEKMQPYGVQFFLDILDKQHLLSDSQLAGDVITGKAFICEIENYYHNIILPRDEYDEFSRRLYTNSADDASLLRWTNEYYHVTRSAERTLVSSLRNYHHPELTSSLRDFFFDEVGHEKLLRRSMLATGLSEEDVDNSVPHICTEAMMALLLRASYTHLPTFVTLVALMEGSSEESQAYINALENSTLNPDIIQGQITHEKINIEGDHGNEGREIFSHISALTLLDLDIAKRAVREFYKIRRAMTPWVIGQQDFSSVDKSIFQQTVRKFLQQLKLVTLPAAIPNTTLQQSHELVMTLARLKHTDYPNYNLDSEAELLMLIIENVMWKAAFVDLPSYLATLAWLEDIAEGRASFVADDKIIPCLLEKYHTLAETPLADADTLLEQL